jgi:hypothetical protein
MRPPVTMLRALCKHNEAGEEESAQRLAAMRKLRSSQLRASRKDGCADESSRWANACTLHKKMASAAQQPRYACDSSRTGIAAQPPGCCMVPPRRNRPRSTPATCRTCTATLPFERVAVVNKDSVTLDVDSLPWRCIA